MKKPSRQSGDFFEDFSEWLNSSIGVESMEALDAVYNALDGARVDSSKRRIIWPDGKSLGVDQSVERIGKDSGLDGQVVLTHIIDWLQMGYEPEGLDEDQMEHFEKQIEYWVEEYENRLLPESDF
jgi:hypothetical protein